jgi:hypothetical protein
MEIEIGNLQKGPCNLGVYSCSPNCTVVISFRNVLPD